MKARCILCDQYEIFDEESVIAKKLRNHPITVYICSSCDERITKKTKIRMNTGNFKFLRGYTRETNI